MNSIAIHTTQNVVIDYEPAGLGNRMLASILDGVFKTVFVVTILVFLILTHSFDARSTTAIVLLMVTAVLPLLLYDLLFEIFMHGQTLGKKIMKIKVVKLDGTQPSISSYMLRWLIRIVEIDFMSGVIALISIASSKNSQRLGDMAAGTTVIRIKPPVTLQDTILQTKQVEEYKIVFNQVAVLSDKDVQLIKDVHDFYLKTHNNDALAKMAEKIKNKTGIQTDMNDEKFITTILKDYSNYQFEK